MKKMLALLAAVLLCLSGHAMAEEVLRYDSVALADLYDSVEDMVYSEASRVVACGAATLDYMVAALTQLSLGQDAYLPASDFAMIASTEKQAVLFVCMGSGTGDAWQSMVITYYMDGTYSLRFAAVPADALVEGLKEFGEHCYQVPAADVLDATQQLIEQVYGTLE